MTDSAELRQVEAANAGLVDARHALRESVVAARLAGHTWADVAGVLSITRQAAAERFACDEQVAKAWHQVEMLLGQIRGEPAGTFHPMDAVRQLSDQGQLHPLDVSAAQNLKDARDRAIHERVLLVAEAERITDQALPLVGNLYSLAHPA